jgi:hypothetical protein
VVLIIIAVVSSIVAVAMSVVAWRSSSAERARSAARVEALARAIDGDVEPAIDLALRSSSRHDPQTGDPSFATMDGHPRGAVLSAPRTSGVGSRLGLSLAAGAFVVTSAAAAAIVFSSESPTASVNPGTAGPAPAAPTPGTDVPIELVTLDHERDGETLTVHGAIRNPTSGAILDQMAVVVSTIGLDGSALSSVRSTVDSPALPPGGQSTFSVTVPHAGDVGRYRVSFRSGDRVVSHVDKRIGS